MKFEPVLVLQSRAMSTARVRACVIVVSANDIIGIDLSDKILLVLVV